MASLAYLTAVRSQLALGLEVYLQRYADLSAWPRSPFLGQRRLTDMYQQPSVVRWDAVSPEERARWKDGGRRGEFVRPNDDNTVLAWRSERLRERRVVILGQAGEGKTTLTELTCRAVARASLRSLRRRSRPIRAISTPIWLTVDDVLKEGSLSTAVRRVVASHLAEALSSHQVQSIRLVAPSFTTDHVVAALSTDATWLFLDALDERPSTLTADPPTVLRQLAYLPGRLTITSRVNQYDWQRTDLPAFHSPELATYRLIPLSRPQRLAFIDRWFSGDSVRSKRLVELIESHSIFRDMSSVGLLLTLLCATTEGNAEDLNSLRRVELYDLVVRDIVRRAHKPRRVPESLAVKNRMSTLRRAAWHLFPQHAADRTFSEVEWDRALLFGRKAAAIHAAPLFRDELENDMIDAGLIVELPDRRWSFLHRTFFEVLAAGGLGLQEPCAVIKVLADHADDPDWREVAVLAIGFMSKIRGSAVDASLVVEGVLDAEHRNAEIVVLLGETVSEITPGGISSEAAKRLQTELIKTMRNDDVVLAKTRAAAGRALGRIGDPRFHGPELWCLPALLPNGEPDRMCGFIEVPAGPFTMGSDPLKDPLASFNERDRHSKRIEEAYWIGRYPVTVGQFQVFAETPEGLTQMQRDRACLEGVWNHPVVRVSWHDAQAYCAWLNSCLQQSREAVAGLQALLRRGYRVSLPLEAEWERAARGTDGRIYPWGTDFNQNFVNCWDEKESAIQDTSAVGCFGGGASPCGAEDMAGNVWEWTASPWTASYRKQDVYRADRRRRVVRGGSFVYRRRMGVRAACRYNVDPDDRIFNLGFRVTLRLAPLEPVASVP